MWVLGVQNMSEDHTRQVLKAANTVHLNVEEERCNDGTFIITGNGILVLSPLIDSSKIL